jgi:hypothetical protein
VFNQTLAVNEASAVTRSAMGRDEEEPHMKKLDAKNKQDIEDMENIGSSGSGNPNFAPALQLAVRCSVLMCLLAAIVWVPVIRKPFPNQIQARIPLVICLFVFTINPLMGIAIQNACCGILGTFWACLHMWVMNGIFPGGMKPGMSSTSACAIFGWVNMLVFMLLVLWSKCGIGTKMFALATDIGFMLAFLNPASTMPFSEKLPNLAQRHSCERYDCDYHWMCRGTLDEPHTIPNVLCVYKYEEWCCEGIS